MKAAKGAVAAKSPRVRSRLGRRDQPPAVDEPVGVDEEVGEEVGAPSPLRPAVAALLAAQPARQAALAAFNLRNATNHSALASLRETAIAATDELVAAAGRAMA